MFIYYNGDVDKFLLPINALMTLTNVSTKKNFRKKIFQILNEKKFSLTSLVLQKTEEKRTCCRRTRFFYNDEKYLLELEEFFVKHCSGLRSLELNHWPKHTDHNPLEFASRTNDFSHGHTIFPKFENFSLSRS